MRNQFSDWEFTRFVEIGFFIALVGLACAAISAVAVLSRVPSRWWLPVASLVVILVCVAALHSWTRTNASEITRMPPELENLIEDTSTDP